MCREKCGACCIIPSISSVIPGMPKGKPGGVACIHLTGDMKCGIFDHESRPRVCGGFKAEKLVCGNTRSEAAIILSALEGIDVQLDDI
jgi:Fe-S-cluster containining protein